MGVTPNGDYSDRLSHSELPVILQQSIGQIVIEGPESNDVSSLPDNKVPHNSRDRPSSRKTTLLLRVL